jgi:DNA-binding MarR family transcriptional regulator
VSDDAEKRTNPELSDARTAHERRDETLRSLLLPKTAVHTGEATEDHILSILAVRRGREAALGRELFSDPAWDILLELYAANLGQRRMALPDLARSIDVPESTTSRWITALANRRLVVSSNDANDPSRLWIELTSAGAAAMKRLVDHWESAFRSI